MKRSGNLLAGTLGCVLVVTGAQADTPYQQIVERNVFGLKPMPPPGSQEPKQETPPPTITLEGITSILGRRQVIFKCQVPPAPGQPGEKSYLMNEGEEQDDIQVVAIDESAGTVKFNNHGTPQTLDLKMDSNKPSAGAAAGGGAMPGFVPGRMPVPAPGAAHGPGFPGLTTIGGGPGRKIPQRAMRTPGDGMGGAGRGVPQYQPPTLNPDEQTILIELERERNSGNPDAAPLPITELTPTEAPAGQTGAPPAGSVPAPH